MFQTQGAAVEEDTTEEDGSEERSAEEGGKEEIYVRDKETAPLSNSSRPVPLTASPFPSPSPAQFFLDLTLQNPKPETQVWGTTPVSRLRLFMMLRRRDNFNKKYLIKFRTNDK